MRENQTFTTSTEPHSIKLFQVNTKRRKTVLQSDIGDYYEHVHVVIKLKIESFEKRNILYEQVIKLSSQILMYTLFFY